MHGLSGFFERLLVCPWCKSELVRSCGAYACSNCSLSFPVERGVPDFRIPYPDAFAPSEVKLWRQIQSRYERFSSAVHRDYRLEVHRAALRSVREVYEVFRVGGVVLDVGGQSGTLRRYLGPHDRYLSVDPFREVLSLVEGNDNMLALHPVLREPCDFVCCVAEHLPLRPGAFDIVHMRSVLDHLYDPFAGLLEAYRVLRPEGQVIVGLAVKGGRSSIASGGRGVVDRVRRKLRQEGVFALLRAAARRLRPWAPSAHHTRRWTYDDLLSVLAACGFAVDHVLWQKPPHDHCVYVGATKCS